MKLRSKVAKRSEDKTENISSPDHVVLGHLSCRNAQSSPARMRQPCELSSFHKCLHKSVPSLSSAEECSSKPQSSSVALHVDNSDVVVGRKKEISILNQSLFSWISERCSGSIYVSGAPGTGKTATVTQVVQRLVDEKMCRSLFLNCMQMTAPRVVYTCILESLGEKPVAKSTFATEKIIPYVEDQLTRASKRLPLIVVLDEVDQLALRYQEVFYT